MNKFIWMFWEQGFDSSPEIVKDSFFSWKKFNQDYQVIFLDKNNLSQYLSFDVFKFLENSSVGLGKAGVSDLIRLLLLKEHGGIWVDATTYCLSPLSKWLYIKDTNFFCFRQPSHCIDRKITSWFLAADKGSVFIDKALRYSLDYLSVARSKRLEITHNINHNLIKKIGAGKKYLEYYAERGEVPYFWMFYIFNEIIIEESGLWGKVTSKVNKYSSHQNLGILFLDSVILKSTYRVPVEYSKKEAIQDYIYNYNSMDEYLAVPYKWKNHEPFANVFESKKAIFYDIPGCFVESFAGHLLRDFKNRYFNKASRINLLLADRAQYFNKLCIVKNPIDRFLDCIKEFKIELNSVEKIKIFMNSSQFKNDIRFKPYQFFLDDDEINIYKIENMDDSSSILSFFPELKFEIRKLSINRNYSLIDIEIYNFILNYYARDFEILNYQKIDYSEFLLEKI